MDNTQLFTSIEKSIRDVVNNQDLAVNKDSRLISDLGLESIDLLDISSELENTIGQELDFKEVVEFISKKQGQPANMKLVTVGDLMTYISSLQA